MKTKVFWCHPKLMDYRLPFFNLFEDCYETVFYFIEPALLEFNLTKSKIIHSSIQEFNKVSPHDVRQIYKNIEIADIFISSFVFNKPTLWGILFSKLLGKKCIVWEEVHSFPDNFRMRIKKVIFRFVSSFIDAFFVLGKIQAETLYNLGISPNKIFRANEFPGSVFAKVAETPVHLPLKSGNQYFLYLGRLIEVKGVEYLLRAFSNIREQVGNVELIIVGEGELEAALKSLQTQLGLDSVHFIGPIYDVNQKAFLLKNSIALIVPSIITDNGLREGGPLVVLEALSAGVAVVGTDALGSSTIFIQQGVNGYVVPARDYLTLSQRMVDIINNPIDKESVLATFENIKSFDYQLEMMNKAIDFVS